MLYLIVKDGKPMGTTESKARADLLVAAFLGTTIASLPDTLPPLPEEACPTLDELMEYVTRNWNPPCKFVPAVEMSAFYALKLVKELRTLTGWDFPQAQRKVAAMLNETIAITPEIVLTEHGQIRLACFPWAPSNKVYLRT